MQNPNVPRHDNILVKLDIGVPSDISYRLISARNLSKFCSWLPSFINNIIGDYD